MPSGHRPLNLNLFEPSTIRSPAPPVAFEKIRANRSIFFPKRLRRARCLVRSCLHTLHNMLPRLIQMGCSVGGMSSLPRVLGVAHSTESAYAIPNPKLQRSLMELSDAFSGPPLFHRFPRPARFDNEVWRKLSSGVGSQSIAKDYAMRKRRPGPGSHESDLCVDGDTVLRLGAPPSLLSFPEAWGGISLFVPIGERGRAAWRYAHEAMAVMQLQPHLPCHVSFNPVPFGDTNRYTFVFDRSVGRSWGDLQATGIAHQSDRAFFPSSDTARVPLFHHVLLMPLVSVLRVDIDQVARCEGWDACERIAFDGPTLGECTIGGVYTPPPGCDKPSTMAEIDPGFIADEQLRDVERLLNDGLAYAHAAPLEHRVEALLYMYLFQHEQAYFAGPLDRVCALDGGRCAHLLLAAAEYAFPGASFGRDFWAHDAVGPITSAARAFLACVDDSAMT